jgi:hypothetical protein
MGMRKVGVPREDRKRKKSGQLPLSKMGNATTYAPRQPAQSIPYTLFAYQLLGTTYLDGDTF